MSPKEMIAKSLAILKSMETSSTLTHLGLGLLSESSREAVVAMLRVNNTTLVSMDIGEDEYTDEELDEISDVLQHHNTSLTTLGLSDRYDDFKALQIQPHLRNNMYLKLAMALPAGSFFGAAFECIASKSSASKSSASALYCLLRKNTGTLTKISSADLVVPPAAKRAKTDGLKNVKDGPGENFA